MTPAVTAKNTKTKPTAAKKADTLRHVTEDVSAVLADDPEMQGMGAAAAIRMLKAKLHVTMEKMGEACQRANVNVRGVCACVFDALK